MYYLKDGPERAFVAEELMLIPKDTGPSYTDTFPFEKPIVVVSPSVYIGNDENDHENANF